MLKTSGFIENLTEIAPRVLGRERGEKRKNNSDGLLKMHFHFRGVKDTVHRLHLAHKALSYGLWCYTWVSDWTCASHAAHTGLALCATSGWTGLHAAHSPKFFMTREARSNPECCMQHVRRVQLALHTAACSVHAKPPPCTGSSTKLKLKGKQQVEQLELGNGYQNQSLEKQRKIGRIANSRV